MQFHLETRQKTNVNFKYMSDVKASNLKKHNLL